MDEFVRIIIFQDSQEYSIHSDLPLSILQFSRGIYEPDPEYLITINSLDWSIGEQGIETGDPIDDFNKIWQMSVDFYLNSDRLKKEEKRNEITARIKELQAELRKL